MECDDCRWIQTLDDVFESINSDVPGISKLNLKPITDSAPNGWFE